MTPQRTLTILLSSLIASTSAQLLTDGNSALPSCATSCTTLTTAEQTCGGTSTTDTTIWSCFCQSVWTSMQSTPAGICASVCTSAVDNQQVTTWFNSNCGSDNGASEHASGTTATSSSAVAGAAATSSSAALPSTSSSGGSVDPIDSNSYKGSWWSSHYKWVIMLIVLFVGLLLFALLALWLKRRHDRKADHIREPFNAGITERSAPNITDDKRRGGGDGVGDSSYMSNNTSTLMAGGLEGGSGRNTPSRTRDAFMPYGYGYARSESRVGSRTGVDALEGRRSPMTRGGTPMSDIEKEVGMSRAETPKSKRSRKVLVRERNGPESPDIEKI